MLPLGRRGRGETQVMTTPSGALEATSTEDRYERLAEEVTSVASHELRTPLRGIASLVEWISEDLGDEIPERVAHNLARVQSRVRRLEAVADALAGFAAAGRRNDNTTPVKPLGIVHAALRDVAPPDSFAISVGGAAAPFQAARRPLQAVLRALIINAVQHHDRPDGTISVTVNDAAGCCLFVVQDDGPGVPDHAQDRLFAMFQTLNASDGAGIGLAMARRIAEAHGGSLEYVSEPGPGATFELWWPRTVNVSQHDG